MKLLLCIECSDVVALRVSEARVCHCGKSGGQYVNQLNAKYWGPKAVLLGFHNSSLIMALAEQIKLGDKPDRLGRSFEAFIIPTSAPSIKKADNATDEAVFHNDAHSQLVREIFQAAKSEAGTRSLAKKERSASGSAKGKGSRKVQDDIRA